MVFCIGETNADKLSSFISNIVRILKNDNRIYGVGMCSYLIHIPVSSLTKYNCIYDGINICLTLVVDEEIQYEKEEIKIITNKIRNELNYNLVINTITRSVLKENIDQVASFLDDVEVLYDRNGELTLAKQCNMIHNQSENLIEYQPRLNINKM